MACTSIHAPVSVRLRTEHVPPSGLFSFRAAAHMLGVMPRYFFTVVYPDLTDLGDLTGPLLQNDAAAIHIASRVFNDFCADRAIRSSS